MSYNDSKPTSAQQQTNWLRYSGACVTITLNPMHWVLVPHAYRVLNNEWPGPNEKTWRASWLMITIRIWIDDGQW
jgi:hypothetical protein